MPQFAKPINLLNEGLESNIPNPKINYDNNTGKVGASFNIPLPVGKFNVSNNLSISYNSQLYFNVGYGVGNTISIPRIIKQYNSDRADYLYDTGSTIIELAVENDSLIELELKQFNKYIKKTDGSFTVISRTGVIRDFDKTGKIVQEKRPGRDNILTYKWEGSLLKEISLPNKKSVNLNYKDCSSPDSLIKNSNMEIFFKGEWIEQGKCLYEVDLAGKKVSFEYGSANNLEKVSYLDGGLPIFQASYEYLNDKNRLSEKEVNYPDAVTGEDLTTESVVLKHSSNLIEVVNEGKFFESQKLTKNKVFKYYESGEAAQLFFADFNNDGITDYLAYTATLTSGGTSHLDRSLWFDSEKLHGPTWGAVKHSIRLGKKTADGQLVFEESNDYQLSSVFLVGKTESNFEGLEDNGYVNDDIIEKTESAITFSSNPIIADFDGNGLADILLCGDVNYIAYNSKKGFVEKESGISCPKESTGYDLNNDSYIDLITKDKVYLSSPEGFKELQNIPSEVSTIQNKLANNELKFGIFDLNFDGIPEPLSEEDFLIANDFYNDKVIEILKVGDKKLKRWTIYPPVPLIKSIKYAQGGTEQFKYKVQSSIPVVSENIKDNLVGEKTTESINFSTPFLEPYTNRFLGFSYVTKEMLPTTQSSGVKIVTQYFKDNDKDDVFVRASKHGLVDTVYSCELGGCLNLVDDLQNKRKPKADWFKLTSKNYTIKKPYSDRRVHIFLDSSYTESKSISHNINMNSQIQDTYVMTRELSKYNSWGPMKSITTMCEDCMSTAFGADEIGSFVDQKVENFIYYDHRVLKKSELKFSKIRGKKTKYSHTKFDYYGELESGNFVKDETELVSNSNDSLWRTKTTYDKNGHVLSKVVPTGTNIINIYSGLYSRVKRIHDGKFTTVENFNEFGKLLSKKEVGYKVERNLYMSYGPDNLVRHAQTDDYIYDLDYKNVENGLNKTILVTSKDDNSHVVKTINIDGFGNQVKSYIKQNDVFHIGPTIIKNARGQVTSKHSPVLSHEVLEGIELVRNNYFEQDRISESLNLEDGINMSYQYSGNSKTTYRNNKFLNTVSMGQMSTPHNVKLNKTSIDIEKVYKGAVYKLGKYNFFRDLRGNLTRVEDNDGVVIFQQDIGPNNIYINLDHEVKLNKFGQITEITTDEKLIQKFSYDSLNRLEKISVPSIDFENSVVYNTNNTLKTESVIVSGKKISFENEYDSLNLISSFQLKLKDKIKANYRLNYAGGLLKNIPGIIEDIQYNDVGLVTSIDFGNLILDIDSSLTGKVKHLSMGDISLNYEYNNDGKISSKQSFVQGVEQLNKYNYDLDGQVLENTKKKVIKRDDYKNLLSGPLEYKNSQDGTLSSIEGKKVVYKSLDEIIAVGNEKYLTDTLHQIDGTFVKYLKLEEKIVGAWICSEECVFYPILTDHLNSVIGIFSANGDQLVSRSYSTWGELKSTKLSNEVAKNIDKLIRYDFAGLVRPYKSQYLVSKSRVYSPAHGQWHKIDPQVYLNPEVFIKGRILESDSLVYVAGDPVNYADPSGRVGALGAVAGGVIGGVSGGIAQIVANDGVLDMSVLSSTIIGAGTGALIGFTGGAAGFVGPGALTAKSMTSFIFAFTGNLMSQTASKVIRGGNETVSLSQAAFSGVLAGTGMVFSSYLSSSAGFAAGTVNDISTSVGVGVSFIPLEVGLSAFGSLDDDIQRDSSEENAFNANFNFGIDYSFELDLDFSDFEIEHNIERDFEHLRELQREQDTGMDQEVMGAGNE